MIAYIHVASIPIGGEQKGEEGVRGVIPTLNSNFLLLLQLSLLAGTGTVTLQVFCL